MPFNDTVTLAVQLFLQFGTHSGVFDGSLQYGLGFGIQVEILGNKVPRSRKLLINLDIWMYRGEIYILFRKYFSVCSVFKKYKNGPFGGDPYDPAWLQA